VTLSWRIRPTRRRFSTTSRAGVGRIITFPQEAEKPIISELKNRYEVMTIVLFGDTSERTLKELAERVKDDLLTYENVSQVDVAGVRPYEIAIEVSEETLRKYALTFDDVVRAVRGRRWIFRADRSRRRWGDPGRTKGQKYTGREFEPIVVMTRNDGTAIRLRISRRSRMISTIRTSRRASTASRRRM